MITPASDVAIRFMLRSTRTQVREIKIGVRLGMVINSSAIVGEVAVGSQAEVAGIQPGARIVSIGGSFDGTLPPR